ncbi:MAG: 4-hydroxy-tetrahydrodipicolinate reductase [Candidatus Dadabacteria bacterium]|nr:4-hydroxy-tetrahydrodipicolinate reductase [Candidatus Dadabacteria bacterium]
MINVAVAGASGRMGSRLLYVLRGEEDLVLIGATEREGHPDIGRDAGEAAGVGELGVKITGDIAEAAARAHGIIDFTLPASTLANAQYASRSAKAMVIGTTGLSDAEKSRLKELTEGFPCVFAPNMSVGVNVMLEVAGILARLLGEGYDVEIIEAHHKHKVDAPSGTALKLAEVIAEALSRDLSKVARFERHGQIGQRPEGEIGIQTLRGGDVVGEHTAIFFGSGERIELTHRAMSRDNFAVGAVRAMRWLVGKPPGLYTMNDVLGI